MTTINDKVLKAVFGSTAEEAAAELAVLQAKGAAWSAARGLAAAAALTAPTGSIIIPVLGYEDQPGALVAREVDFRSDVSRTATLAEHRLVKWVATEVVTEEYSVPVTVATNYTPFEGDWEAWKMAREASHAQAALEAAQAAAAIKKLEADQLALAKKAAQQADSVRQQHVRWFTGAYRDAVYALWNEEFLKTEEKDAFLKAFETQGKLREAAEVVLALRAKFMALCPVPEDAGIDPTEKHVTEVADLIASWVNGDLDIAIPTA